MRIALPPERSLQTDFTTWDAIRQAAKWTGLAVLTLGMSTLVSGPLQEKEILEKTRIVDPEGRTRGRIICTATFKDILAHGILWHAIVLGTLGLAWLVARSKTQAWLLTHCQLQVDEH